MKKITAGIIKNLLELEPNHPSITMYIPTHKSAAPPHVTENITRFKNLSSQVIKKLESLDKHSDFLTYYRHETAKLIDDREFWGNTGKSVIFCMRENMFDHYDLPFDSEEYISIDDNFHLAPLAGMTDELQTYYVLNLSMHDPKLYRSDMFGMEEEQVGLPRTPEEALNIDEKHLRSLQFSSIASPKGATYHGHGGIKDNRSDDTLKYFKIIDHLVNEKISRKTPLILAGTPAELAVYRDHSTYPKLLNGQINEQYGETDLERLHASAQEILYGEVIAANHEKLRTAVNELKSTPRLVSEKLKSIKEAAIGGRVQSLLVNMRYLTKDSIKDGIFTVQKIKFGDKPKILDDITREVIAHGGNVRNMPVDKMPNGEMMIAINRY